MRENSVTIRVFQSQYLNREEEAVLDLPSGKDRALLIMMCRLKQRKLQEAWNRWWMNGCNDRADHDYTEDVKIVLQRELSTEELRSELEIEVIWKWALRNQSQDPSCITCILKRCSRRKVRVDLMQDMRLELFKAGDVIVSQKSSRRPQDGHFSILEGQCEMFKFEKGSKQLSRLRKAMEAKAWDDASDVFRGMPSVATLLPGSGFGELMSSRCFKEYTVSICAHREIDYYTSLIFVSQQPFNDCLSCSECASSTGKVHLKQFSVVKSHYAYSGECMDFLRSIGIGRTLSSSDLHLLAASIEKIYLPPNSILFTPCTASNAIYLLVSGEIIVDTTSIGTCNSEDLFIDSAATACYLMTSGSILGEEAFLGHTKEYTATAACISTVYCYKFMGEALRMLIHIIKISRSSALIIRDELRFSSVSRHVNEINIFSSVDSIRKQIATRNQLRGVVTATCVPAGRSSPAKDANIKGDGELLTTLSHASERRVAYLLKSMKNLQETFQMHVAQVIAPCVDFIP